jgi:ferredoxin-type protein NapF
MVDGLPALNFAKGECTFCGQCDAACPEPVFKSEPTAHFNHVMVIGDECLAFRKVDCQACRDACPTQAIRFRPRLGGPFIPELNETLCTGCGACVSVCPANVIEINERSAEVQYG